MALKSWIWILLGDAENSRKKAPPFFFLVIFQYHTQYKLTAAILDILDCELEFLATDMVCVCCVH